MLNAISNLEFTFVCCEQHKGGGHQCLEYISRTDCGVGSKTKVNVTGGGMAAHRRKEKAVRRHIKLPNEHFSHAYPAPYRLPKCESPVPTDSYLDSFVAKRRNAIHI